MNATKISIGGAISRDVQELVMTAYEYSRGLATDQDVQDKMLFVRDLAAFGMESENIEESARAAALSGQSLKDNPHPCEPDSRIYDVHAHHWWSAMFMVQTEEQVALSQGSQK